MSKTKCDSGLVSPWFQDDYRNGSQFRGKQMPSVIDVKCEDGWDATRTDQNHSTDSKLNKYSLVIVLPSSSDQSDASASTPNSGVVQMDSGVGSMSPSPPKTPTPDYDSLEDSYEAIRGIEQCTICNNISSTTPVTKKVHFSIADSEESTPKSTTSKTSWRDMLVHDDPLDYHDHFSYCYRQDWVNGGETKSKHRSKGVSKHQHLSTTILHDLEQISQRSARSESKRRGGPHRLMRRSSSLDRFAELRYSQRYHDRSPLLCDPDPLKSPTAVYERRKGNKKSTRSQKSSESSSLKPVERASCGPGPPLKQLRSYSVESNSNCNFASSQLARARQRSVSGNVSSKKTPVRRVDDETF